MPITPPGAGEDVTEPSVDAEVQRLRTALEAIRICEDDEYSGLAEEALGYRWVDGTLKLTNETSPISHPDTTRLNWLLEEIGSAELLHVLRGNPETDVAKVREIIDSLTANHGAEHG